ncbi:MAG: hypothetical protein GY745_04400 [Actinomycetia bacterium]|nr:hypothetical protein [Actinomycetes bacterium]
MATQLVQAAEVVDLPAGADQILWGPKSTLPRQPLALVDPRAAAWLSQTATATATIRVAGDTRSKADWLWTLAVLGSVPRIEPADRRPFLERLITITNGTKLIGLTDPGPSTLLTSLEILDREP